MNALVLRLHVLRAILGHIYIKVLAYRLVQQLLNITISIKLNAYHANPRAKLVWHLQFNVLIVY
jgi:hypothetical protein